MHTTMSVRLPAPASSLTLRCGAGKSARGGAAALVLPGDRRPGEGGRPAREGERAGRAATLGRTEDSFGQLRAEVAAAQGATAALVLRSLPLLLRDCLAALAALAALAPPLAPLPLRCESLLLLRLRLSWLSSSSDFILPSSLDSASKSASFSSGSGDLSLRSSCTFLAPVNVTRFRFRASTAGSEACVFPGGSTFAGVSASEASSWSEED